MGKKLLVFLMILSLLGSCVSVLADDAVTVYTSDFSKDTDGWYGRGAQSARTAESTLKTTGRQSSWNSPGRDFDLVEGGKYNLSVEVKQDDLDSANFMISIAHSTGGFETYENLAFGTGDTPLAGLFGLMKREGYRFPCDIELEYKIPEGSDAVREVDVSHRYCKTRILT